MYKGTEDGLCIINGYKMRNFELFDNLLYSCKPQWVAQSDGPMPHEANVVTY